MPVRTSQHRSSSLVGADAGILRGFGRSELPKDMVIPAAVRPGAQIRRNNDLFTPAHSPRAPATPQPTSSLTSHNISTVRRSRTGSRCAAARYIVHRLNTRYPPTAQNEAHNQVRLAQ